MARPISDIAGGARDPALTGIRALAIALVLVSHLAIAQALPYPWTIRGAGQMGVMLFFVLSGYLMARRYGTAHRNAQLVRHYTAARLGRVLPAYLVVLAVSWLAVRWDPAWPYAIRSGADLWRHLLMIEGGNALWAIPVEVRFYALFLAALVVVPPGGERWLFLLALPVCWMLGQGAETPGVGARPVLAYLPWFVAGCVLGCWLPAAPEAPGWLAWPVSLVGALSLAVGQPYVRRVIGIDGDVWRDPLVLAAVLAVFVAAVWRLGAFVVLTWRPALWLGTISYGVYLYNPLVIHVVSRMGIEGPSWRPLTMAALTLALAWASWRWLEAPALRHVRRRAAGRQLPQDGSRSKKSGGT